MKIMKLILLIVCLTTGTLLAQQAKVTELMSKDLPDVSGKEGLMIMVEYPPGSSDPVHRHYADAFVYVLEGTIIMQVKDGKEVTLTPGQTFYEGPSERRASCDNLYDVMPTLGGVCSKGSLV